MLRKMENEIIFDNFSQNEVVHYPLIILKGHILNRSEELFSEGETIALSQNNEHSVSRVYNKNKFKFILELNLGKNVIKVTFKEKIATIELIYASRNTLHSVIPLYIICDNHDGRFQSPSTEINSIESALKRITLCSKLLQSVIAEKMYEANLERKTFKLSGPCEIFRSKIKLEDALNLKSEELWERLVHEIMKSKIGCQEKKFLAFLSWTRYCGELYSEDLKTHEELVNITKGYVALGGGPLALFGTACLYTWPEYVQEIITRFENDVAVDKNNFLDDSCYRGTQGACFSTTLGSVLHELCHTFDLGHMEKGIMGRGFDNIYKVFTNHTINSDETDDRVKWKKLYNNFAFKNSIATGRPSSSYGMINGICSVKNCLLPCDPDETFWTKNCLAILYYHRWFNDVIKTNECSLKFDGKTYFVTSTCGIRIIEIRNEEDEMVLHFWIFDGRILKFSFQIPPEIWDDLVACDIVLFIEDNSGHILKITRKTEAKTEIK